jgi:hypothetical protein
MKYLISFVFGLFIAAASFAQGEVEELVSQGIELHDLVETGNCEAFTYYISQSINTKW